MKMFVIKFPNVRKTFSANRMLSRTSGCDVCATVFGFRSAPPMWIGLFEYFRLKILPTKSSKYLLVDAIFIRSSKLNSSNIVMCASRFISINSVLLPCNSFAFAYNWNEIFMQRMRTFYRLLINFFICFFRPWKWFEIRCRLPWY